jgi:hypothetical protein
MRKYHLFTGAVVTMMTLVAACGGGLESTGETTPPAEAGESMSAQTEVTSTPTETSTSEPVSPSPTQEPESTPTLSPTAAPSEAAPAELSGNPDLDYAQVQFVRASQDADGLWTFHTTVRHNDEGWDHYADAWQVVDLEGNLFAERILAHPHDNEQPFTRSQSNIDLPAEMTQVIVRAKCNVHGFGGQEVLVDLTVPEGENFEVSR